MPDFEIDWFPEMESAPFGDDLLDGLRDILRERDRIL
jgi:hypothetical protein